ncbi:MAG: hypothetical protein JEZ00_17420 [Anaerolineaceae bacterium]|nr:hypothetical protein [Anaerolineaceae bacterium]
MQENWLEDLKNSDPKVRSRAIVAMAESHDAEALKALKYLFEKDADPQVRELAKKAGAHLWKKLNAEQPQSPNSGLKATHNQATSAAPAQQQKVSQPSENEQTSPAQETVQSLHPDIPQGTPTTAQPTPDHKQAETSQAAQLSAAIDVNSKKLETARIQLNRALSYLVKGDQASAMRSLQQACKLNPKLLTDQVAMNLASELTGLPASEAMQTIGSKQKIDLPKNDKTTNSAPKSRSSLYMLIGALLVLVVALVLFLQSGLGTRYAVVINRMLLNQKQTTIAGYDVYVIPPKGDAPADGWPVVVGLHGYGGTADQMLGYANQFTNQGILYIVPTFGGYEPFPGNGPIQPMTQILSEVKNNYSISSDGVVMLGLSQGGEFSYRFSLMRTEWIKGVVTAGAPYFDEAMPPSRTTPYNFSWGSEDGLQDQVIPILVNPKIQQGYNITTHIISGYGHEMTPYAIEQAINMAKQ